MMNKTEAQSARANRAAAAAKYKPAHIRLLLVAEAPPCTLDRYFYFEDVQQHDSLFRYVYRGLFDEAPSREGKAECLAKMREAGVFLIDVSEEPIADGAKVRLTSEQLAGIVPRCAELKPDAVILIKSNVHDLTHASLAGAGFNVADVRMPFPASGQQKKFETLFKEALGKVAFRP
jgi:hypothetical protein